MPAFKKNLLAAAVSAVLTLGLVACNDSDDSEESPPPSTPVPPAAVSTPNPAMSFNRIATFNVCTQAGASCESGDETAAEIVAASKDGKYVTVAIENERVGRDLGNTMRKER